MRQVPTIRDFQDRQAAQTRAAFAQRANGESIRDAARRGAATSVRRAAADGHDLLVPDEMDQIHRQRGLGSVFDRRA